MPGMHGMRKPCTPAARGHLLDSRSALCDAVTILPFLIWLGVSIAAIADYSRIEWYAPIACATYSTIMSGVATVQLWRRSHVRIIYLHIDDGPAHLDKEGRRLRCDLCVACFFALVSLAWAVVDLVANAHISAAKKTLPLPCYGICSTCTADPHCQAWSANVSLSTPIVAVCPTAARHTLKEGNATFSCVADAAWMFLTFGATTLWISSLLLRKSGRAKPVVGGIEQVSPPPSAPESRRRPNGLNSPAVV